MSSYCAASDVIALGALGHDQGQNPTTANISSFIEYVAGGDIDPALLLKGYDAPLTSGFLASFPVAQNFLLLLNAKGALKMYVEAAPTFPPEKRKAIGMEYDAMLKQFLALDSLLDMPKDIAESEPRGPGVTEPPEACGRNRPFFHRYQRF